MNLTPETVAGPVAPVSAKRHSGLGVASFVLALVSIVAMIAVFSYAGYIEGTAEGGVGADESTAMLIGFATFACIALLLVGLVLGLAGLFQSGRRRVFAAVGIGLNAAFMILIGLIMWVGLTQE